MAFKDTGKICPFVDKVWLSSPTMHGDEAKYMMEAYDTNWMSTVGKNINEIEAQIADLICFSSVSTQAENCSCSLLEFPLLSLHCRIYVLCN